MWQAFNLCGRRSCVWQACNLCGRRVICVASMYSLCVICVAGVYREGWGAPDVAKVVPSIPDNCQSACADVWLDLSDLV